jgi:hypothetical protein
MYYVKNVVTQESVQDLILSNEELVNNIITNYVPVSNIHNGLFVNENLGSFTDEDVLTTYENIADFAEQDMVQFIEAISGIMGDQELTEEAKIECLAYVLSDEDEELSEEAFYDGAVAGAKKMGTAVADKYASVTGGQTSAMKAASSKAAALKKAAAAKKAAYAKTFSGKAAAAGTKAKAALVAGKGAAVKGATVLGKGAAGLASKTALGAKAVGAAKAAGLTAATGGAGLAAAGVLAAGYGARKLYKAHKARKAAKQDDK